MRSGHLLALLLLAILLWPARGEAFCGFYVSGAGGSLVNDATQVVLMRSGLRTVLSMQNDYHGPPESFALVIPVPVVLQKENVRTLPRAMFERIEKLDGPRLVEYWEQDPCPFQIDTSADKEGGTGTRARGEEGSMGVPGKKPLVKVEAEFTVDEYDIVILSALDAVALETWLHDNGYQIPAGADRYLRPYVQGGSKFFVARVDPRKLSFTWGRATLSPLRFFYDTETFALPVRLGLMNAEGPQDLVIHILAPDQRYETANYDNLIIPTNLEVADATRDRFPSFYASLFDRTVAGRPRAVVTEYAWSSSSCDPCPVPPLSDDDLRWFGGDVTEAGRNGRGFALTRLHARYTRETLGEDLIFRPAQSIEGGREAGHGKNTRGAQPSPSGNSFQARYVIRHRWEGPVSCADPTFDVWGGPPSGDPPQTASATRGAAVRDLPLDQLLVEDSAELGVRSRTTRAAPGRFDLGRAVSRALVSGWLVAAAALAAVIVTAWSARRAGRSVVGSLFVSLVLGVLPLGLLGFRDGKNLLRETGFFVVPVLAAFLLALAAVLASRRADARPGSARTWLPLPAALVPAGVGLLRTDAAFDHVRTVALEPGVDADMIPLIHAQGQSESLSVLIFALWLSALLCLAAAWPRTAIAFDPRWVRALAGSGAGTGDRAIPWSVVLAGALCVAVAFASRAPLDPALRWTEAPLLAVIVVAVLVAARLPRGGWEESWRSLAGVGGAALLAALGALLAVHRRGFDSVTGMSIDPDQKVTLLLNMLHAERLRALLVPLDVILAVAPAAWVARRLGQPFDRAQRRALLPALAALVVLLGAGIGQRVTFDRIFSAGAERRDRFDAAAIKLPAVPLGDTQEGGVVDARVGGPALLVNASGNLLASTAVAAAPRAYEPASWNELARPPVDADAGSIPLLAADADLHLDALLGALSPLFAKRQTSYRLVEGPRTVDARLKASYHSIAAPPHLRSLGVDFIPALAITPQPEKAPALARSAALGLLIDGDRARVVMLAGRRGFYEVTAGGPRDLPLAGTVEAHGERLRLLEGMAGGIREVVLACPPSLTVGELSRVMNGLLRRTEGRWSRPKGMDVQSFVVTTDRASLAQAIGARGAK